MNQISCPECRAKLGEEYIRCPRCHAFVLDSSPWRSDHNLVAIPGAVLVWWGLDALLRWQAGNYYDDWISRSILLMGVYGIFVLIAKFLVSQRQDRAFRIIRTLVGEGELGPETLGQARDRLRDAGLKGYNRYIAYHRLQWLLSAEAATPEIRLGLLEAQRQHAETDWDGLEGAFASAQFLIWLLPSVGFLGTVYGMSGALLKFQGVVGQSDLAFRNGLEGTVAGLATAFHTTLVGLAAVIPVLALATMVRRRAMGLLEHTDKYFIRLAAEQLGDPRITTVDAELDLAAAERESEPELEAEPQPVVWDESTSWDATAPAPVEETNLATPAFTGSPSSSPDAIEDDVLDDDAEDATAPVIEEETMWNTPALRHGGPRRDATAAGDSDEPADDDEATPDVRPETP